MKKQIRSPRRHELYGTWENMRQRCNSVTCVEYIYYGGRGIKVHPSWDSFEQFIKDVGERPSKLYTLDRYPDINGDYKPGNVRWATRREQMRNRRNTRYATYLEETKPLIDWCEQLNLHYDTMRKRIDSGWTIEKAFSKPEKRGFIPNVYIGKRSKG